MNVIEKHKYKYTVCRNLLEKLEQRLNNSNYTVDELKKFIRYNKLFYQYGLARFVDD